MVLCAARIHQGRFIGCLEGKNFLYVFVDEMCQYKAKTTQGNSEFNFLPPVDPEKRKRKKQLHKEKKQQRRQY